METGRPRAHAHYLLTLVLIAAFAGIAASPAAEAVSAEPPKPTSEIGLGEQASIEVAPGVDPRSEYGFAGDSPTPGSIEAARSVALETGRVRVVVGLRAEWAPEGLLQSDVVAAQRAEIADLADALVAAVPDAGVLRRYETIPFIALSLDAEQLDGLLATGAIASLQVDDLAAPSLRDSIPLVGSDVLDGEGIDGRNTSIAIIDTGVQKSHPFMAGGVIWERCFADSDGNPATTAGDCPNGLNFQDTTGAGEPCTWSSCDHGTHVAGIAAGLNGDDGDTPLLQGVANGAWYAVYQVFHRNYTDCDPNFETTPCARTWRSDYLAALEHLYANRTVFSGQGRPLAAANMSLGGGQHFSHCDATRPGLKAAIDNLRSAGIATVASSGNAGYKTAVGSPACISTAISVGNTTKNDVVSGSSNVAAFLDLFAPGTNITSSIPTGSGTWATFGGTSMSAPHVSGAIAILKQVDPGASVDHILAWLEQSGYWILDDRAGAPATIRRPRIWLDPCLADQPECFAKPANNAFASASNLKVIDCDAANPCYSYLATKQPNEPDHASSAGGHSVWFKWRAPADGTIDVDTAGSDFDTLLAVYTGDTIGKLGEVASNDDDPGGGVFTSRVEDVAVDKDVWYRIAVDGYTPVVYEGGPAGRVHIDLSFTPAPHLCNGYAATIVGSGAAENLTGTPSRDVIVGYGGADTIEGKGGGDELCGGAGNDTIDGGAGRDGIFGGAGADVLRGGNGKDEIDGRNGRDILRGNDGDDDIDGGSRKDAIYGGLGDDVLRGGGGADEIWGGAGFDEIRGGAGNDSIAGGGAGDHILGGAGADAAHGQAGNDTLEGGEGQDSLWGEVGRDTILGQQKIDSLFGGQGDDLLDGGPGTDSCVGGSGSDTLISC